MKFPFLLSVACLALFSAPAAAQVPSLEHRVNWRIEDRSLEDVVRDLRARTGANIVVIPREGDEIPRLSIELVDIPWRDALEIASEKVGFTVEERDAGVLAVTNPPRATFKAEARDITQVIETIAAISGANIAVGPDVTGNLTVRFTDVPWRDALEVSAKTLGYTVVEENGGILRVVDPAKLTEQLITRWYQLRYLRPRGSFVPVINSEFVDGKYEAPSGRPSEHFTVLEALSRALSKAGSMDYIDSQNVIIVSDTIQVHESLKEILGRLDIEPLQVFVDVKFVSTNNSDILNLGVDYGDSGPAVSATGGSIPITFPFNLGNGGFEDYLIVNSTGDGPFANSDLNASGTIIPDTIFGALNFTQVTATLRLLQRDSSTEVIQAPKIIALDGHPATIFVGETIRYAEAKSEQGQAGGLQLSVGEASGSPVEVGFQLLVRPNVIPGTEKLTMEIIPKETSLSGTSGNTALAPPGFDVFTVGASGFEGTIALPRTRSSTIVTTMMLESGQTAVIGGLTTDTDVETSSRVPGLWRIPVLGKLFQYKSSSRDRRSLIIFVTPTIVHTRDDIEFLLQQEVERRNVALKDELNALLGVESFDEPGLE